MMGFLLKLVMVMISKSKFISFVIIFSAIMMVTIPFIITNENLPQSGIFLRRFTGYSFYLSSF